MFNLVVCCHLIYVVLCVIDFHKGRLSIIGTCTSKTLILLANSFIQYLFTSGQESKTYTYIHKACVPNLVQMQSTFLSYRYMYTRQKYMVYNQHKRKSNNDWVHRKYAFQNQTISSLNKINKTLKTIVSILIRFNDVSGRSVFTPECSLIFS